MGIEEQPHRRALTAAVAAGADPRLTNTATPSGASARLGKQCALTGGVHSITASRRTVVFARFPRVALLCALAAADAQAAPEGATPVADSLQPSSLETSRPALVAKAAGIAFPGFGAMAAVDARVTSAVYLGVEGGGFDAPSFGQWFAGMRASYRISLPRGFAIVPSVGLAHVAVLRKDTSLVEIVGQNSVSPTAGVELAYSVGDLVVGAQGEFLPVQLTEDVTNSAERHDGTARVRALYDLPVGLFAALAF
jgi:hypothetical protein